MRILVTGASGWIGRALLPELRNAGHQVLGLARSQAAATTIAAAGADVLRGDLDDLDALRAGAAECDGVIHLAFMHDVTQFDAAIRTDLRTIETFATVLEGTGKALVVTSGTPALAAGRVATEHDWPTPDDSGAARASNARATVELAARGIRASVVRIPRSAHGAGDRGLVAQLVGLARKRGHAGYVGDGSCRWPAVHVLDAAHLYRLAVERAPAGSVLHAVGDEGVPTRDIAAAIARHLNVPTGPAPMEEFGFLGPILAADQPASSQLTRELLGWQPIRPRLLDDLEHNHYFG